MQPFLSIVTINYNNKEGLEKTVESVKQQLFKDFEFIIVDGSSTDGSKQYIDSISNVIDYSISEPDTGIYNAMNKGINISKGKYLLFLNSGDYLNGQNSLLDFISNSDFNGDLIYGDYKFEKGEKIFPDKLTPLYFVRTSLPHQSTLFKREVFEQIGLYDEQYKIVADRDFYIKCFLTNKFTFKHIQYPLTVFDRTGISNNSVIEDKHNFEKLQMFKNNYGVFYEDYITMIDLQKTVNSLKKQTISGLVKRCFVKIRILCGFR